MYTYTVVASEDYIGNIWNTSTKKYKILKNIKLVK